MLSRVANLIYWTARQLERAENTARLIDVNTQLVLDMQSQQGIDDPRSWEPLVYVSGNEKQFFELYGKEVTERAVIEFLIFDRRNLSSIMTCFAAARENARCIRDQLATEVWEAINTAYLSLKDDNYTRFAQLGATDYLGKLRESIQLFYGVAESMLPRNQGWWFFELGRYLERADNVSRILDVKYFMLLPDRHHVGSALDMIQWASVLRSCSAFEAFRRSRRGQLNLERVVDYLLRDDEFPRSILFSLLGVENSLAKITGDTPEIADNAASRAAAALRSHLEQGEIRDIIAGGLHEYLDNIQVQLVGIHEGIQSTFVEHEAAATATQSQSQS